MTLWNAIYKVNFHVLFKGFCIAEAQPQNFVRKELRGFVLRDDRLLQGYFVFTSRTQKAADKNRRSQKPPAAWICARTLANGLRRKADTMGMSVFW
jgi:hypothetical protein